MKRRTKLVLALVILLLLAADFGYNAYTDKTYISGSTQADLTEQLIALQGSPYTAGVLGEFSTGDSTITLLEDLTFLPIEQSRLGRWNDSFPKKDAQGTPMKDSGFFALISVQVQRRWYFTVDGEPLPDGEWSYCITYTGYEDNDLNSRARAFLDPESKTLSAQPPSEVFLDYLTQTVAGQPQLSGLLAQAQSFVKE